MIKISDIDTGLCATRLARVLRRYIGRGLTFECDEACEILHLDRRTLDSYLRGDRTPGAPMMLRFFGLPEVGHRIAAEMLGMVGLTVDVAEPGAADPHGANAEIAATAHRLADMLRDGRIDHREAPELEERFLALSQDLTGYVRASRAQRGVA